MSSGVVVADDDQGPAAPDDGDVIDLRRPALPRPGGRIPFFSGLEGLRGLAVIAVLLFHGGFPWAVGGYLGVSTFFTLSGFLITLLLLTEVRATRTVDVKGFYRRRIRRLLPASLAAIALAVVFAALVGSATQQRNIGGDATAALLDVANWRFIFQQVSYADLFAAPSPLLHFWSLAIEEQFYLLFPLVGYVLLKVLRVGRRRFGQVLMGLMALSLAITLFAGYSQDRIYFGTETRSFELLAGALLAVIVLNRQFVPRLRQPAVGASVAVAGSVALAACVGLWVAVPQTAGWLYHGGLAGYSGLSCLVILAAISPTGPVIRLLSLRLLRWFGELSYGIYVFHWPIFLWLDEARTGLSIWPLFALRLAVTLGLALVSAHLLELRVRRQQLTVGGRSPIVLVPAVVVLLLLGAWTTTRSVPAPTIDFAAVQSCARRRRWRRPVHRRHHAARGAPSGPHRRVRRLHRGNGRGRAGPGQPRAVPGAGGARKRHARLPPGPGRLDPLQGRPHRHHPDQRRLQRLGHQRRGPARRPPPRHRDGPLRPVGRPRPEAAERPHLARVRRSRLRRVHPRRDAGPGRPPVESGALVVWLTTPPVRSDPARVDRMNELIEQLPHDRPGKVAVLDLAGWVASVGDGPEIRSDRIHIQPDAAADMSRTWLIPKLRWLWAQTVRQDPSLAALPPSTDPNDVLAGTS